MKPILFISLLLIAIISCNKSEHISDKLAEENLNLIHEFAEENYRQIAKLDPNIPDDPHNFNIYSDATIIYYKCDSLSSKLFKLKNESNSDHIKKRSQEYFNELIKTIKNSTKTTCLKDVEPLEKATSNLDNNILKLWIFGTTCLLKLRNNMTPFCGIIDQYELISNVESKKYKSGETIRIITSFNNYKHSFPTQKNIIKQLSIKEIRLNNALINPTHITSRFNNEYIEFVPTQKGNYSITFSKTIERPNRKIETYESKVEFTVLPK
jgi:hypothetical protein